jgi:DNA-binding Lrp family transcriptional regulator
VNSSQAAETATLDRLDEQIVRALQLRPRVPFRRVAAALDVSEQTVARRYRALVRAGLLRIVASVDPVAVGQSDWVIRLRCRPPATLDLGRALARRPEVSWVSVTAGGSELVCSIRSHSRAEREHLLLDRLPRASAVLGMSAAVVLRRFVGGRPSDWSGIDQVLTDEQRRLVSGDSSGGDPVPVASAAVRLGPADHAMLDALAADGRAPLSVLAAAAGLSEGRAARRLAVLLTSGVVFLHVDLVASAIGFPTGAYVWLTVEPAHLDAACAALAAHAETPYVAAVSGRSNIMIAVMTRSLADLYDYVTRRIGTIQGVQGVDVEPVLRQLKQAGSLLDGDRLAPAAARTSARRGVTGTRAGEAPPGSGAAG